VFATLPDIKVAFESHVQKSNGCWPWQGPRTGDYGRFNYAGRHYWAHVFALALDGRPVPKGMEGLHHCDNPICLRPSHLYVGTPKMNNVDAYNRTRTDYGVQHPRAKLTPEAVLEMRRQRLHGISFRGFAHTFNISVHAARCAILNKTWRRGAPSNAEDIARLKRVRTSK
jgi:hypothetical protein